MKVGNFTFTMEEEERAQRRVEHDRSCGFCGNDLLLDDCESLRHAIEKDDQSSGRGMPGDVSQLNEREDEDVKTFKEELEESIGVFDRIGKALQTALAAEEFNAKQSEREKLAGQLTSEIEARERIKAKLDTEIEAQTHRLSDVTTKVNAIEAKHGKSLRVDELDAKIAAREQQLRETNAKWNRLVKKIDSAAA